MTTSKIQKPRVLAAGEINQLLDAAKESSPRDFLLVSLPLENGLRLGEIASLRKESIQGEWLLVEGKAGTRRVPVSPQMASALEDLAQGGEVIWRNRRGEPVTADALKRQYRRLFDRAGISGPWRSATTLRLTFADRWLKRGGSFRILQEIMGHPRWDV